MFWIQDNFFIADTSLFFLAGRDYDTTPFTCERSHYVPSVTFYYTSKFMCVHNLVWLSKVFLLLSWIQNNTSEFRRIYSEFRTIYSELSWIQDYFPEHYFEFRTHAPFFLLNFQEIILNSGHFQDNYPEVSWTILNFPELSGDYPEFRKLSAENWIGSLKKYIIYSIYIYIQDMDSHIEKPITILDLPDDITHNQISKIFIWR